jgi:hypothetical protein
VQDEVYILNLTPMQGDNERTVELWFKTTQTKDQCILNAGEQSHTHAFSLCLTDGKQFAAPSPNTPGVYLQMFDADVYIPNPTLTDNQWHYIAVTLSGSTVTIDVDGQTPSGFVWNGSSYSPLATPPFTLPFQPDTISNPSGAVGIGTAGWAPNFTGEIGEVAIYPTALTAAELAAHYATGTGASPPPSGGGGSSNGSGTTPIPVPPTGGSCVAGTAKCPPPRRNGAACSKCSKFDGATNTFYTTVGGIYARVRNYSPWVDPASYSVSAWVALEKTGSGNELAQIGWRERPYGQRDTLVEFLFPPEPLLSDCNPAAVGSTVGINKLTCNSVPIPAQSEPYTYYTVLYGYEPGQFTFFINGNKVARAPASFVPNRADVIGETNTFGDQMPGDAGDPEVFENINVYVNGAWQPFTPTRYSENTIYNGMNYGGYLALPGPPGRGSCLGIWDTAYGDASAVVRSICNAAAQVSSQATAISVQATQHVRSSAVVPLSCPSGATACSGTISLEQSPGGGSLARVAARSHRIAKPIAFSLPPGGRERLRLRLTHAALSKLKSVGRLRVRAVIAANGTRAHASHITSRSFTLLK